jgi:hypothetical protein
MISLVVFFGFFSALLFFVSRADEQHIKKLEKMPLENQ